jgi:hypothetical protein
VTAWALVGTTDPPAHTQSHTPPSASHAKEAGTKRGEHPGRRQRIHQRRALERAIRAPLRVILRGPRRGNRKRLYRFTFAACLPAHTAPPRPRARLCGARILRLARILTLALRHLQRARVQMARAPAAPAATPTTPRAPAAPAAGPTTPSQRGGGPQPMEVGAPSGRLEAAARLDLYCEPQQRAFCGAHALNALLGRRVVTGDAMYNYLSYRWPGGRAAGHFSDAGWFTLEAINFWLHEHTPPGTEWGLHHLSKEFDGPLSVTGEDVRTRLEIHECEGAMAHIPHPRSPHRVALVRSPQDRQWYLADSIACIPGQAPVVRRMGKADWDRAAERWNLNVLAPVNAAGLIVGGGRAGNTATPPFGWQARPTAEIRDMTMPEGEQRDASADMAAFVAANGIRPTQPRPPGTNVRGRCDITTGTEIYMGKRWAKTGAAPPRSPTPCRAAGRYGDRHSPTRAHRCGRPRS